eukprot:g12071.t1 g12071   contig6:1158850-1159703(+)
MPSSTTTLAAVAATATLIVYGAARLTKSTHHAPSSTLDIEDLDPDDCISPDDVVAIFDKLFMQMQQVVLQLSQQVQQIQMSGQVIPEKQLRQLLKSEFDRALGQLQAQVFEDNDVDADCLEEATWEFMEEPEQYPKSGAAGGGNDVAKKELSPEELVKAATLFFETITEKMLEMAQAYKEEGKDLSNPQFAQQYHMEAATDANEVAEAKLKESGVTMSEFRSAIDKHSRIPSIGQAIGMLQMKQQQELMAAGIPM